MEAWLARWLRAGFMCLALALSAGAQGRANFPWWNSPIKDDLGLTPEQSAKIRQIVRSYRARLLDARNTASKAEGDLEDLMNDPEVNTKDAQQIINRLATARAETSRVFLEMSVQLRSVLTLEQWRTLVRRWDEIKNKRNADTQVPP